MSRLTLALVVTALALATVGEAHRKMKRPKTHKFKLYIAEQFGVVRWGAGALRAARLMGGGPCCRHLCAALLRARASPGNRGC